MGGSRGSFSGSLSLGGGYIASLLFLIWPRWEPPKAGSLFPSHTTYYDPEGSGLLILVPQPQTPDGAAESMGSGQAHTDSQAGRSRGRFGIPKIPPIGAAPACQDSQPGLIFLRDSGRSRISGRVDPQIASCEVTRPRATRSQEKDAQRRARGVVSGKCSTLRMRVAHVCDYNLFTLKRAR